MSNRPSTTSSTADTPMLVLFVDRDHARLIARANARTERLREWTFAPDTASWRPKEGRAPTATRATGQSVGRTRGAQRDAFAARLETHRRRFWRQVANAAAGAVDTTGAQAIVLAGPAEATRALTDLLPATVRRRLAGTVAAAAYLTDAAIVRKAGPIATRAMRARAAGLS